MHPLLPEQKEIRIYQQLGRITSKQLEPLDQLLLILPKRVPASLWKQLPGGLKLKAAMRRRGSAAVPALYARLANKKQTLVSGATLAADAPAFEQLTLARKLVASATDEKAGSLGIAVLGFDGDATASICRNVVSAALAAAFRLPAFKSDPPPEKIRSIRIVGLVEELDLDRVRAEASGNNLARWLTTMPPNKLDAAGYADLLSALAKERGWQYKRYPVKELEKMGAGAFLAVAQGRPEPRREGHHLRYRRHQPQTLPGDARHALRHAGQRRGPWDAPRDFPAEAAAGG
jgi:leucyl aminopeptidase